MIMRSSTKFYMVLMAFNIFSVVFLVLSCACHTSYKRKEEVFLTKS